MMHDGTSTGSDARCATPATAKPIASTGENRTRRLSPQQRDILDALRCMEWCEIPDLLAAADVASEKSLRVVINGLRRAGYDIDNRRGWASRGRVGAYSLRGAP